MSKTCVIIGSGVSGLAAAACLAQDGYSVTVLEKNSDIGGRAGTWKEQGFTFDLGPSFYWMPDVFERFFQRFGQTTGDHFRLVRLDPSYRIIFGKDDAWSVPAGSEAVAALFEGEEVGAGAALHRFLTEAKVKYDLGMKDVVYKPSLNWSEYIEPRLLLGLLGTSVFSSLRKHVRAHFSSERIRQVLEFPALFLGASPQKTPALYSLMNHADIALGTWYPMGGMGHLVKALANVAKNQGAVIRTGEPVTRILVERGRAVGVMTGAHVLDADIVLAAADYHHAEHDLLEPEHRQYSEQYWDERTMAPSTLLFYLGLDRKLDGIQHHTLFFDGSLDEHSKDIHEHRRWPEKPLFYVSCTSCTDPSVAPAGCENLMILIPIASGSVDSEATRERYYALVVERMKVHLGVDITAHVKVKRSYCVNDLEQDHNAYKGNAYGLASTLRQTGPLRPRVKSNKVKGLYFAGQLTVPGPGMPPALISGQLVADLIRSEHSRT